MLCPLLLPGRLYGSIRCAIISLCGVFSLFSVDCSWFWCRERKLSSISESCGAQAHVKFLKFIRTVSQAVQKL